VAAYQATMRSAALSAEEKDMEAWEGGPRLKTVRRRPPTKR
jgi:hypothetical protein